MTRDAHPATNSDHKNRIRCGNWDCERQVLLKPLFSKRSSDKFTISFLTNPQEGCPCLPSRILSNSIEEWGTAVTPWPFPQDHASSLPHQTHICGRDWDQLEIGGCLGGASSWPFWCSFLRIFPSFSVVCASSADWQVDCCSDHLPQLLRRSFWRIPQGARPDFSLTTPVIHPRCFDGDDGNGTHTGLAQGRQASVYFECTWRLCYIGKLANFSPHQVSNLNRAKSRDPWITHQSP